MEFFRKRPVAAVGASMIEAPSKVEKRLKQIHNYISRMPSLSTTVTKVLEICNSPNSSPNDLNRVISLDPVLTGQVLKLINSAYYALPNQVNSITRAIIMLGINTVKNLALSAAVLDGLGVKKSSQSSMYDFWNHSICVGVTAKLLAVIKGVSVSEREEYFVAGLLHDLGKIPINSRFPEEYVDAMDLINNENISSHRAENMVFGIDHCTVGGMIADKWKLSRAMIDSLSHHHDPKEADEENGRLVSIVALGNIYSNMVDRGTSEDPANAEPMLNYLLEQVGVNWITLSGLHEKIFDEIEKAKIFLQITQKG